MVLSAIAASLVGAAAVSAPGAGVARAGVCPVSTGAPPPCCEPVAAPPGSGPCCAGAVQPICCPPNADCASLLTISASPDPSTAGERLTVSGQTASSRSGQQVALWQRPAGSTHWSQVATTTTDSSGRYAFHLTGVERNRSWYVTAGGAHSATISQRVRAAIRIVSDETACGRHRMTATMRGSLLPAQPGQVLRLLGRRGHGRWRVLERIRLGRHAFVASHRFRAPGGVQLRLSFPGDRDNAPAHSPIERAFCS
jgi:hypothetical protein